MAVLRCGRVHTDCPLFLEGTVVERVQLLSDRPVQFSDHEELFIPQGGSDPGGNISNCALGHLVYLWCPLPFLHSSQLPQPYWGCTVTRSPAL